MRRGGVARCPARGRQVHCARADLLLPARIFPVRSVPVHFADARASIV
ncbi:hypothetical protein FHS55_001598 [Angulomicrobium tetraedrale]|uniref:Uncharacterized protein n=1 Tax=Ancylobacter tetraedralis TaxID=217068 RepID=A0A839Z7B3_9HYPH|nr:hypothetical protein [Ancylobacter tetraedralis]